MEDSDDIVVTPAGAGSESGLRQVQGGDSEILLRMKKPATLTVEVGGVAVLTVTRDAGSVRIDLGESAAERVVLGDSFRAFINEFLQAKFDAHVHPIPSGQFTAPPHAAFVGTQMPDTMLSNVVKAK
jgi:hypothetical protein